MKMVVTMKMKKRTEGVAETTHSGWAVTTMTGTMKVKMTTTTMKNCLEREVTMEGMGVEMVLVAVAVAVVVVVVVVPCV